jgi:glucose-6-phosphate 1-epimerase
MDVDELQSTFAMPGVLAFDTTASGLVRAHVTAPSAEATIYLQGAHLTHWKPADQEPVLFLSARTELLPGKPIRGGIPIIFPWFGPRHDGHEGPAHGFARTSEWELAFAALAGDEMHLTFTLAPNEQSRALGFDHFRVALRMTIGRALTLQITVANDSSAPLLFEEALHTYFAVGNVENTTLTGLGETAYLDKRDGMKRKVQAEASLAFTGTIDRTYLGTAAACAIHDASAGRRILIEKSDSQTTVVWNPWAELAANMQDMDPDGWKTMLCVETANVGESAISLPTGATHTMTAAISIDTAP